MSAPDVVKGTYLNILLGNGATPEVFSIVCGLTTKSITDQTNTNDTFVRDCATPEGVPVRRLNATGRQWSISGEGLLNRAQLATLRAAASTIKNYRFVQGEPAADNISDGYWSGAAMLTNLQVTGRDGDMATVSLSIESDGAWTWADA